MDILAKSNLSFVKFHVRRFVLVFLLTIFFAFIFGSFGMYLDVLTNKRPLFLIGGLFVAFILLQVTLLKVMRYMGNSFGDKKTQ
jgi:F0F1-type ATP synthase assembly protein I